MYNDRRIELEVLRRCFEGNMKIDSDHMYYLDIKHALSDDEHLLSTELHDEMWINSTDFVTRSDKDIKRTAIELSNKRKVLEHAKHLMKNIDNHSKLAESINTFKLSMFNDD